MLNFRIKSFTNFTLVMCVVAITGNTVMRGQACEPLGADTPVKLSNFIRDRTASSHDERIEIISADIVKNTCYMKLLVKASDDDKEVTMYVSPDRRFISSNLYDLDEPPQDATTNAKRIQARLLGESSPRLGSSRHVLVEFGDFECPFCATFATWYESLPADLHSEYSLVFKFLPLHKHIWAESAANAMACINKEEPSMFWPVYKYIYESQADITPDNLGSKLSNELTALKSTRSDVIADCIKRHDANEIVSRDVETAKALQVHSTPTLFLDGYRVMPLRSEQDLIQLLRKAADN